MNQIQNLLHDSLIGTGHVQQCALIRRKDGAVRASSVGFHLSPEQIKTLLDTMKNPSQARDEGLVFDDKRYKCVRADYSAIYSKYNKRGLILIRTATLLLIGTYNENMFPSVCVEAMEKLADYFKEKGK